MVDIQEQLARTASAAHYDLGGAGYNLRVKLFDNIMEPIQLKICRNIYLVLTEDVTAND